MSDRSLEKRLRETLILLAVALTYTAAGKFGLSLATVHPSASAVWAPTGISLAAYLLLGRKAWMPVFLGAFIVNSTTYGTLFTSLGIAMGNTLEGFIGAELVKRYASWPNTFTHPLGFFRFVVLGALLAPFFSAAIGVLTLSLAGLASWTNAGNIFATWWIGDSVGALVVAPALLLFFSPSPLKNGERKPLKLIEGVVLFALSALSILVVFGDLLPNDLRSLSTAFICIPAVVYAAYAFGPRTSSILVIIVSAFAITATIKGQGPFGGAPIGASLLLLQTYLGTISITGLSLAAAVSASHNLERSVARSERRFRTLVERSFDAIVLITNTGRILYATPSITRILGYPLKEFIGTNRYAYVHKDDQERLRNMVESLERDNGASAQIEFRYLHRNGAWIWVKCISSNLLHVPGIEAIVSNFHDISARKREQSIREQFTALASHQLRTPLTKTLWALEDIRRSLEPHLRGEQLESLDVAERAASRMSRVVRAMLVLGQIHSGRMPPPDADLVLHDQLRATVEEIDAFIDEGQHEFVISCPRDLRIRMQPELLDEVFLTLLQNAALYSPPGTRIDVRAAAMGNGDIRIEVEDHGSGIAEDDRANLFSMFFRGDAEHRKEGSGLGLYLAHTIIQALGGTLQFASEVGKGTTFTILFPAKPSSPPQSNQAHEGSLLSNYESSRSKSPMRDAVLTP